jgi:hypothetical protein
LSIGGKEMGQVEYVDHLTRFTGAVTMHHLENAAYFAV